MRVPGHEGGRSESESGRYEHAPYTPELHKIPLQCVLYPGRAMGEGYMNSGGAASTADDTTK